MSLLLSWFHDQFTENGSEEAELRLENDEALEIPLRDERYPFPLWRLGSGQRAGWEGPSFTTAGILVAHQRLFIASNYEALLKYVAAKTSKPPLSGAARGLWT